METMARDIFPADVIEVGGRVFSNVRVFVTDQRIVVWRAKKSIPEIVINLALSEAVTPSQNVLEETLEVTTLTQGFLVSKRQGCGCHSPLKAIGPPAAW